MNPNTILADAPSTVIVGGVPIPIQTDFRTGIRVMKAVDDSTLEEREKLYVVLVNYYGIDLPEIVLRNQEEAVEKALFFLNFNEPRKPKIQGVPISKDRTWDWDWDARRLIADFHREYGIELADPNTKMHWWDFYGRFKGLSDTSQTVYAISIRGTVPHKDMSAAEKKRLKLQKAELMLPARTEEEAEKLTNFVWGLE